jgi:hypothetical protein
LPVNNKREKERTVEETKEKKGQNRVGFMVDKDERVVRFP